MRERGCLPEVTCRAGGVLFGIVLGLMIALLWRIGQNNNAAKIAVLYGVEFNQQKGKQE